MCVILAKKIKGEWNLFKFRDRKYNPTYDIKDYLVNGLEVTYLRDKKSHWIEGINDNKVTLVSAALDNHADASIVTAAEQQNTKTDKLFKEYLKNTNLRNYEILKRVLRQPTIEEALDVIVSNKFIGNTFLTDGEKLYSIEIAIPQAKLLKYRHSDDYKEMPYKEFKVDIMNNLDENDFKVSVKDYTNKTIAVKTNHSIDRKGLGYVENQKGYESSIKRREIALNYLKNIKDSSIEDIVYMLSNLDLPKFDSNPENRPLRNKDKINLDKEERKKLNISSYYTTDIFGFSPSKKTIYVLPLYSKIVNYNTYYKKDTKTHIIVLNKNIFMEALKVIEK